jgi:hypothetical protein
VEKIKELDFNSLPYSWKEEAEELDPSFIPDELAGKTGVFDFPCPLRPKTIILLVIKEGKAFRFVRPPLKKGGFLLEQRFLTYGEILTSA